MLNGIVGYQILEDGTPISLGLVLFSSLLIFVGTGYIALDTGFSWTGFWDSTLKAPNQAYALYTLYQLVPIVFLVVYYLLEAFLVLKVLGERRPMCMFRNRFHLEQITNNRYCSLPNRSGIALHHRTGLPIRH